MFRTIVFVFTGMWLVSCDTQEVADLIITNGNIYTVDTINPRVESVAIKNGRIVFVGDNEESLKFKGENTQLIDAEGQFVMPGFIEGHGHFSGLGYSLINLNFLKTKSWEQIVDMVDKKVKTIQKGDWIVGRGWHQEKWDSLPSEQYDAYPVHTGLSKVSPDNPVLLFHASGHSLFANEQAMNILQVTKESNDPAGGKIIRDQNGQATGVFEETAMKPFRNYYDSLRLTLTPEEELKEWNKAIQLAQQECLRKGVTSFQDAGSKFHELDRYLTMAEKGEWDVRMWAMVRHTYDEMKDSLQQYIQINKGDHFYTCNAIKSEVDGALGAFGAWLLQSYNDKPGFEGQNTTDIYEVKKIGELAKENDMQFCVHAIGDRANRVVVDVYEGLLGAELESDHRWRIEHAQHLDQADIPRIAKDGIIASMQGVHCTSDAPFIEKRLGKERSQYGAYAWRSLLDAGVIIANGTDAPVEDVDPIQNFYASVTRKRMDDGMEFYTDQSMTREEAIFSYTLANAYAAFEEKDKGSLSVGKLGDVVVLSNDLINCSEQDILKTEVLYTIVGGEIKYDASIN